MQPMTPQANYKITNVGSTSAQTTIATGQNQIRFKNDGPATVYYEIGDNPTATVGAVTSTPLFVGNEVVFSRDANATKIALIGDAAGPSTVWITTGSGI